MLGVLVYVSNLDLHANLPIKYLQLVGGQLWDVQM